MNTEHELKRLRLAVIFLAVMVAGLAVALIWLHYQVYQLAAVTLDFIEVVAQRGFKI